MEVQHSDMSADELKKYQNWADELSLLKSGGSDYHGYNAHYGIKLGIGRGQLNIPHEYIEKIIEASGKQTSMNCYFKRGFFGTGFSVVSGLKVVFGSHV